MQVVRHSMLKQIVTVVLGEEFLVTRMIFTMILAWILLEIEDIEEHLEVWPTKWQGWNLDPAIYPCQLLCSTLCSTILTFTCIYSTAPLLCSLTICQNLLCIYPPSNPLSLSSNYSACCVLTIRQWRRQPFLSFLSQRRFWKLCHVQWRKVILHKKATCLTFNLWRKFGICQMVIRKWNQGSMNLDASTHLLF